MGRGRAGGPGHPVRRGRRLGQEHVIIPHLMGEEQTAWAPPLRLDAVELKFVPDFWVKMLLSAN